MSYLYKKMENATGKEIINTGDVVRTAIRNALKQNGVELDPDAQYAISWSLETDGLWPLGSTTFELRSQTGEILAEGSCPSKNRYIVI